MDRFGWVGSLPEFALQEELQWRFTLLMPPLFSEYVGLGNNLSITSVKNWNLDPS